MSLVAATALGLTDVEAVRARIVSEPVLDPGADSWRLVVQSYSSKSLAERGLPDAYARPRTSTQRAITAEELRQGVDVRIVDIEGGDFADRVVVAWVEPGAPDLEFDGMRARPPAGAYYGVGRMASAEVVLRAPAERSTRA